MVERYSKFKAPDATRVDRTDEFGVAVRNLWRLLGIYGGYSCGRECIRDEEGLHFVRCGTSCVEIFEGYVADFAKRNQGPTETSTPEQTDLNADEVERWQTIDSVPSPPENQYASAPFLVGRQPTETRHGAVGVGRSVRALITKEILVEPLSNNLRADWPITHWAPLPAAPGAVICNICDKNRLPEQTRDVAFLGLLCPVCHECAEVPHLSDKERPDHD
jgi:hypothetical protein